jgi:VWFA-related protein
LPKLEKALNRLEDVQDEPALNRHADNLRQSGEDEDQDNSRNRQGGRSGGPSGADGGGSTHLFDAVYLASNKVLKLQTGRKALIVIGDGDDQGSKVTKTRAIRAAQQADVLIYCIRIVDKDFGKGQSHGRRFNMPSIGLPGIPGMGIPGMGGGGGQGPGGGGQGPGGGGPGGGMDRSEGKKNLEALASQTGGALYEVSKKVTLSDVFAQIQEELRNLYSLGYTPGADALFGYRHIKVTVKPKGLTVQARDGYYAENDKE